MIVSPKYQIVIPKAVREALHPRPSQKMQIVEYDGRTELFGEQDIKGLHGFLKGINTEFKPVKDRLINILDSAGRLAYLADEPTL